jgi:hypothetical protein
LRYNYLHPPTFGDKGFVMSVSRRQFSKSLVAAPVSWAFANQVWANTPDRIALVVGNSAYKDDPLPNAKNDARDMAAALRELKFDVVEAQDATRSQMQAALAEVGKRLAGKNATALFYFAGHGLQLDWRNYLMPVDAVLNSASDVAKSCVDVEEALGTFVRAKTKLNVVVLDACRNNPFTEKATGKGLAQMDAPPSTLLAYATAPGNVAEDGKGSNGLYTSALLPELKKPEQRIEDVFKRTRFMVRRQSLGRQIPWESTSLEDDFYFLPPKVTAKATEEQVKREMAAEFAAWDRVKDSRDPDVFIEFLRAFPSGTVSEMAQFRLDQLTKPTIVAAAGKGQVQALASGARRYRLGDWIEREMINFDTDRRQTVSLTCSAASDDLAEFNNGVLIMSQMGATLKTRGQTFNPGLLLAPADLSVGKRWRSAFTQTGGVQESADTYFDLKAVARETLALKSGPAECIRVEGEGWASRSSNGRAWGTKISQQYWVELTRMWIVRSEVKRWPSGERPSFTGHVDTAFRRGSL